MNRRWIAAILAAALCLFAAKVTIAFRTHGATDILFWEADSQKIRNQGAQALYRDGAVLYRDGVPYFAEEFNHPPFMIRVLSWWASLERMTGLPLRFWLRFCCALADVAGVLLLLLLVERSGDRPYPKSLLLVAASPVSLMISGFHGNTDPIAAALVLLAVYLLVAGQPYWLAGAALGMAMDIKIIPLLFVPAILFFIPGGRGRLQFAAGAGTLFLAGSIPLVVQDPLLVWRHVFGYTPQSGMWGLSLLANIPIPEARFALLGFMLLVSLWMNFRRTPRFPIHRQIGLLSFLFLVLTPGFGVQYLAWLVPWAGLLRFRQALAFHATAGIFLFSYYQRGAHGMPWDLANSADTRVWCGAVVYLVLLSWLTLCWLTVAYRRQLDARSI